MGNAEGLWEKGRVIPMWRVWKDEAGMRWGNGRQTECIQGSLFGEVRLDLCFLILLL